MNKNFDLQEGFYLEDWLVEPKSGCVTKDQKRAQLEPKIMSVLVYLAENQGKVVRKQELFDSVWKEVHVSQHVLARAISEIRRVFDDDAQNPRIIQTIPKIGYRLIGAIKNGFDRYSPADAGNPYSPEAFPQPAIQNNPRNFAFFRSDFAIVVIFVILLIFLMFGHGGGIFHAH